eukprot:TRINITY_DN7547_c2_g2_i1.p1 TRINITY_DN7547_c2_g2~~TRINITY_DN7547_c2_g2_i1.p1  ORF type:complete len:679 (+),score=152.73 TRINITY_DN7547_c2_g2_i1:91-2037(+)
MGVGSLLEFVRRYVPGALVSLSPGADGAGAGVPPYDCVYVDANSILHDSSTGDIARLVAVLRILRPRVSFVAAADSLVRADGGQGKPGKYLTACRYFTAYSAASANFSADSAQPPPAKRRRRSSMMSPLALPRVAPPAALLDVVQRTSPQCLFSTVSSSADGPADTKIVNALRLLSFRGPCGKHCIVSRDGDMLLAACTGWQHRDGKGAAADVFTWDAWEDGGTIVDMSHVVKTLLCPASDPTPDELHRRGLDFAALALLALGADFTPSLIGQGQYTSLHALCEKYVSIFGAGCYIVVPGEGGAPPSIDPDALRTLLRRSGIARTLQDDDAGPTPARSGSAKKAKRWGTALWSNLAMISAGRVVLSGEEYPAGHAPPSAEDVLEWLVSSTGGAAEALRGDGECVDSDLHVEVFGASADAAALRGKGEALTADALPQHNTLVRFLPPFAEDTVIYRAEMPLGEALQGRLKHLRHEPDTAPAAASAAAPPLRLSSSTGAKAPTMFKGFGKMNRHTGASHTPKRKPADHSTATASGSRTVTSSDIHSRLWGQLMGFAAGAVERTARDAMLLQEAAEAKKQKTAVARSRRKEGRKRRRDEAAADADAAAQDRMEEAEATRAASKHRKPRKKKKVRGKKEGDKPLRRRGRKVQ